MAAENSSIHEPEALLVDADEVWEDYQRVRTLYNGSQVREPSIPIRIPLSVVFDAIKQMDLSTLQQVATLTEQQLALHNIKHQAEMRVS